MKNQITNKNIIYNRSVILMLIGLFVLLTGGALTFTQIETSAGTGEITKPTPPRRSKSVESNANSRTPSSRNESVRATPTPSPSPRITPTRTPSPTPTPSQSQSSVSAVDQSSTKPNLSIDETVDYINKKLAEFSPIIDSYEYRKDYKIKLSNDRRKIIVTNQKYRRENRYKWIYEVYAESLNPEKVYNRIDDNVMRVIIDCKENISCVTVKFYNYQDGEELLSSESTFSKSTFSVACTPDTQTGERLVNAFRHLIKSLQEEIKRKGKDPNDPFSNP